MQEFYNDLGFILAFILAIFFSEQFLGEEFTVSLLYLVILSMVLINSKKFIKLLNKGVNKNA